MKKQKKNSVSDQKRKQKKCMKIWRMMHKTNCLKVIRNSDNRDNLDDKAKRISVKLIGEEKQFLRIKRKVDIKLSMRLKTVA